MKVLPPPVFGDTRPERRPRGFRQELLSIWICLYFYFLEGYSSVVLEFVCFGYILSILIQIFSFDRHVYAFRQSPLQAGWAFRGRERLKWWGGHYTGSGLWEIIKSCDEDKLRLVISEWSGAPKSKVNEILKEKFDRDKEGHCFAVVAGAAGCAWVTLTSSEVWLDHGGKLSAFAKCCQGFVMSLE